MRRVGLLLIVFVVMGSVALGRAQARPAAAAGTVNLTVYVRDEHGLPVVGAEVEMRTDNYGSFIGKRTTDANGTVFYSNILNQVYRLDTFVYDHEQREHWGYRTVFRTPVPDGTQYSQPMPRENPFLTAVAVSPATVRVGEPVSVTITFRDGYTMAFDQWTYMEVRIDRDQAEPYDWVAQPGPWPLPEGHPRPPISTTVTFTPTLPGVYWVRPIMKYKWQSNPPAVSDDGWWSWSFTAEDPTPAATATTTATHTPTATYTPTATVTPLPSPTATPTTTATATPTVSRTPGATATPSRRSVEIHLPYIRKQFVQPPQ